MKKQRYTISNHCPFKTSEKARQITIIRAHAGRQGSDPCLWSLVRLSPRQFVSASSYDDVIVAYPSKIPQYYLSEALHRDLRIQHDVAKWPQDIHACCATGQPCLW
jgi:hypothetical protein